MGIIDQPKPSQTKSPVAERQPLQPGGSIDGGRMSSAPSTRVNSEAPEVLREEMEELDELANRVHESETRNRD